MFICKFVFFIINLCIILIIKIMLVAVMIIMAIIIRIIFFGQRPEVTYNPRYVFCTMYSFTRLGREYIDCPKLLHEAY